MATKKPQATIAVDPKSLFALLGKPLEDSAVQAVLKKSGKTTVHGRSRVKKPVAANQVAIREQGTVRFGARHWHPEPDTASGADLFSARPRCYGARPCTRSSLIPAAPQLITLAWRS